MTDYDQAPEVTLLNRRPALHAAYEFLLRLSVWFLRSPRYDYAHGEDQKEGSYQLEVIIHPGLDMNNVSRNSRPNRSVTAVALSNKGCAISS